jgi:hypothetical protein
MINDIHHNYYVGLVNGTWSEGFVLPDTLVKAFRSDPANNDLYLYDFYYFKFDQNHNFVNSFIIDNAQNVKDLYSSGEYNLLSMTLDSKNRPDDDYTFLLNGEIEIPRDSNLGKGILITLDADMNLIDYRLPSTGGLGQIARDGRYAYLELYIPNGIPYILVGADTVHNHYLGWSDMEYGFQTIVLAKYDMETGQFIWWKRLGNAGEDQLNDMLIDSEGNLVIHGKTSSGDFIFSEQDTARNYQEEKPFFAKFNSNGQLIWRILRTEQPGEYFHSIKLDHANNLFIIGEYVADEYKIEDTILFNPRYIDGSRTDRSIVIKYDSDGNFKWANQLNGEYKNSNFQDLSVSFTHNILMVSGSFLSGNVLLGENIYIDTPDEENMFLLGIDAITGQSVNHFYFSEESVGRFANIYFDKDNELNIYYIFHNDINMFSTIVKGYSGSASLLKLNLGIINSVNNSYQDVFSGILFPNPVYNSDLLTISLHNVNSNLDINYSIYDAVGRLIHYGSCTIYNGRLEVLLPEYTSGTKIIRISFGEFDLSFPFIYNNSY